MPNLPIAVPFKDVAIPASQIDKHGGMVACVAMESVVLADRITRRQCGSQPVHNSLPGHLIQLTVAGAAHHESEGRFFEMTPGLVAWFHQAEEVHVKVIKAPWVFFTVNFIASHLPPPPFDQRVRQSSSRTRRLFEDLLEAWRDHAAQPLVRHLQVQARLLDLLADLLPEDSAPYYVDPVAQVWWQLEFQLREHLQDRMELRDLCKLSGRSARTISRACHRATKLAPLKRIKKVRLSIARGLILHSTLSISEVAYRVGYDRVQELCRDYQNHVGCTPTQDRRAGPDYRRVAPRRRV